MEYQQTLKIQFAPNFVIVCFSYFTSSITSTAPVNLVYILIERNAFFLSFCCSMNVTCKGDTLYLLYMLINLQCIRFAVLLICVHILKVSQFFQMDSVSTFTVTWSLYPHLFHLPHSEHTSEHVILWICFLISISLWIVLRILEFSGFILYFIIISETFTLFKKLWVIHVLGAR